jgi:hypothetical protein
VCDTLDRLSVRIWGTENPLSVMEDVCDSSKVNVFLPFPRQNLRKNFLLRSQMLPVSSTWTCCNCG